MQKPFSIIVLCFIPIFVNSQNVGIGTFNPEAILHLYNTGTNGAGSRLIFGDDLLNGRTNAYIGEWGWQTNQDSDILELSGFLGLKFTTGSSSAYTPMEILGDGGIKINYLDDVISEDSLVVVKPGGILARRHVSSLPKELPSNPSTGDIIFYDGASWVLLAPGTDGQYLTLSNGLPIWDGSVCNLSHGQFYEGGYIFYLDETGCHGLVTTDNDPGSMDWDQANDWCNSLILNDYDDWFLPTIKQLNLMWENLADSDENNYNDSDPYGLFFSMNAYWSNSTEFSNTSNAKIKYFSNGNQTNKIKSNSYYFRPVRAF